uniref:Uncharacterized protein n=1 Tax=Acrobeloides nanus TaxID=290746 RepID=A0A914CJ46_9BILA
MSRRKFNTSQKRKFGDEPSGLEPSTSRKRLNFEEFDMQPSTSTASPRILYNEDNDEEDIDNFSGGEDSDYGNNSEGEEFE